MHTQKVGVGQVVLWEHVGMHTGVVTPLVPTQPVPHTSPAGQSALDVQGGPKALHGWLYTQTLLREPSVVSTQAQHSLGFCAPSL
jgi:hypothetical protein